MKDDQNAIPDSNNQRYKHQDMTELNGDGNRERGRYGEDLSDHERSKRLDNKAWADVKEMK